MIRATFKKYVLNFRIPGGTSRGVMTQRTSWFIIIEYTDHAGVKGIGECPPLPGLSLDNLDEIEKTLHWVCDNIQEENLLSSPVLDSYPSVRFGLECALMDFKNKGTRSFWSNSFTEGSYGIPINGLIWMSSPEDMLEQIQRKINSGFHCIKLKIGALAIDIELGLIELIRRQYGWDIEIRVDANGSFSMKNVKPVLEKLANLKVHSIEQPIPYGQLENMRNLCRETPIPIALDEDIIRWDKIASKEELILSVQPPYLVLKPGLIGGFSQTQEWITIAEKHHIKWWLTSALESNIGLNAIAQFTGNRITDFHQGLGTGQVFTNNFDSPLSVEDGKLFYHPSKPWNLSGLTV